MSKSTLVQRLDVLCSALEQGLIYGAVRHEFLQLRNDIDVLERKDTVMKVKTEQLSEYIKHHSCPACDSLIQNYKSGVDFCVHCGQRIEWGD